MVKIHIAGYYNNHTKSRHSKQSMNQNKMETLHANSVTAGDKRTQTAWNMDLQIVHVTDGNWPSMPGQLSPQTLRGPSSSTRGRGLDSITQKQFIHLTHSSDNKQYVLLKITGFRLLTC